MKFKSQLNLFVDLVLFAILIPVFIARGEIHQVVGYIFGLFVIIHLVLHTKQIFALIQTRFPSPKIRIAFVSSICIICFLITFWSMSQSKKGKEGRGFERRQSIEFQRDDD